MLILFLPLFLVLLLIGMPVFFAMLLAPGTMLLVEGMDRDIPLLFRNIYNGIDSFPLMAIPFFMLAGELMNKGGITRQLVDFSQSLIGHVRGGLAHVNILSSMLFAGLSGSAVADTSALGSMLIPAMEKNGYSPPLRRRDHRRLLGHRPDHPALGHHDHLRLHHGGVGGGDVRRRGRAGRARRCRADDDGGPAGEEARLPGRRPPGELAGEGARDAARRSSRC